MLLTLWWPDAALPRRVRRPLTASVSCLPRTGETGNASARARPSPTRCAAACCAEATATPRAGCFPVSGAVDHMARGMSVSAAARRPPLRWCGRHLIVPRPPCSQAGRTRNSVMGPSPPEMCSAGGRPPLPAMAHRKSFPSSLRPDRGWRKTNKCWGMQRSPSRSRSEGR